MGRVQVFYSLQSDYCYFLLDRLIGLAAKGVEIAVCPVLGGVLRAPERYRDRDELEQRYFQIDTARTAAYLGLPYAYPDPSPIRFKPGSLWLPESRQTLNEYLYRLYVGAMQEDRGLEFLDSVGRMLWDGSTSDWDKGDHLARAMAASGLELDRVLTSMPWSEASAVLDANAQAMIGFGHWGVPLMVYQNEPFYGQDRFDQLTWRMRREGEMV